MSTKGHSRNNERVALRQEVFVGLMNNLGITNEEWAKAPEERKLRLQARVDLEVVRDYERARKGRTDGVRSDPTFVEACSVAGIPTTRRQARKWLQKRGKAWRAVH